jgi:hypothetical protein
MPKNFSVSGMYPPTVTTPTVTYNGGSLSYGLGWLILFLATGAAIIQTVQVPIRAATQRLASGTALALCGFLLLYVLTSNVRFVSVGLVLTFAGYLLELAGTLRAWRAESTA